MTLTDVRITMADLIAHQPAGLYCPAGDFHIDPWRPVEPVRCHVFGTESTFGLPIYGRQPVIEADTLTLSRELAQGLTNHQLTAYFSTRSVDN